jgi:glycosyltransferase involved in cell wall biosynthesis
LELGVGFDREIFLHQTHGGVSRGFASLISEFRSSTAYEIDAQLLFSRSNNYYIRQVFPKLESSRRFFKANSGWSTLATYGITREISSMWAGGKNHQSKIDVLHATYYRPLLFDKLSANKLAITIHDFIPEKLGWTGFRNPHIGKKTLSKKADLVICVSEVTKSDLMDRYDLEEEHVRVIHQGVVIPINQTPKAGMDSDPYLLFVGHRSGYKNFIEFLVAFSLVRLRFPEMKLMIVGPSLSESEGEYLNKVLGEGNWKALPTQTDAELNSLYRAAFAHVVASSMEGFGMTILESMAQATPVIVNDIPIFREVAGNAGSYFSPNSPDSLLAAIEILVIESNYKRMSQLALKRSLEFSWEHAAARHADAYKSMFSS